MRKLEQIRVEAIRSCIGRGHIMRRFVSMNDHQKLSSCVNCHKSVYINSKPQPNEIDICGEAVALGCGDD